MKMKNSILAASLLLAASPASAAQFSMADLQADAEFSSEAELAKHADALLNGVQEIQKNTGCATSDLHTIKLFRDWDSGEFRQPLEMFVFCKYDQHKAAFSDIEQGGGIEYQLLGQSEAMGECRRTIKQESLGIAKSISYRFRTYSAYQNSETLVMEFDFEGATLAGRCNFKRAETVEVIYADGR